MSHPKRGAEEKRRGTCSQGGGAPRDEILERGSLGRKRSGSCARGRKGRGVQGEEDKGGEGRRRKAEEKEGGERWSAGRAGEAPWAGRPRASGRVCGAGAGRGGAGLPGVGCWVLGAARLGSEGRARAALAARPGLLASPGLPAGAAPHLAAAPKPGWGCRA